MTKPTLNPQHAKRRARRSAMQALYQWQISQQNLKDIEEQFRVDQDMSKVDLDYFHHLLHQVPGKLDELDKVLNGFTDRSIDEVDPVERAILRIGVFELQYQPDIPYKVVLNESVNLAKQFGAEDGHKYVNGILDKVAKDLREVEIQAGL
ncbi:MAG: transcription antitermination factor NusB [Gammaproteobacteria bacterium]|nr:transcription antitermination factor NusB [Gammaproteobacteria bacterium]